MQMVHLTKLEMRPGPAADMNGQANTESVQRLATTVVQTLTCPPDARGRDCSRCRCIPPTRSSVCATGSLCCPRALYTFSGRRLGTCTRCDRSPCAGIVQ